jgi:hypothetical protein
MKFVVLGLLAVLLTGCASKFTGEWLERTDDGPPLISSERRMALKFDLPLTIRYGAYLNCADIVDGESMQSDQYVLIQNDRVAQSGAITMRIEGEDLIACIGGDVVKRFQRVHGPSIFPPPFKIPELARVTHSQPTFEDIVILASAQYRGSDRPTMK